MDRALIADDQADVLEALTLLLTEEGFEVHRASSPAGVLAAVAERDFDVALIDLNYTRDTTSGNEGLGLIERLRELDVMLPVVVMTAWGSIDGAVEAMRRGARDYLQKPWDNARLLTTLRIQVELGRALRKSRQLADENARLTGSDRPELIAESRAMLSVMRVLERVAPSDANVLITGENGTGKEVVARWLHAASGRAARPFVPVNAGGVAEGLIESELFGHVRGAFTDAKSERVGCFALADGGTLFLDEIANMPVAQQARLLRVLQTGEFSPVGSSKVRRADVRVVSATNVDVSREIAEGRFREDLFYRINTVEVRLPSLRDRRQDIALLAAHFLRRQAARYRKAVEIAPAAMEALLQHGWPGNVRELEHVIERAVLLASDGLISVEDLGLRPRDATTLPIEEMTLEEAEQWLIRRTLARCNDNVIEAAQRLGLSRSALYRRLQQYGITDAR